MSPTKIFYVIEFPDEDQRVVMGDKTACVLAVRDAMDCPLSIYECEVGGMCVDVSEDVAWACNDKGLQDGGSSASVIEFVSNYCGVQVGNILARAA